MSDGNRKLEDALRRCAPASPPNGLRGRVLSRVESVHRASRRRWTRRLSAAAALLAAFVIANAVERADIGAGRALLASAGLSRDEQAVKALAADLSAALDGKGMAVEIEQMLRERLRIGPARERVPCLWPGGPGGFEPMSEE